MGTSTIVDATNPANQMKVNSDGSINTSGGGGGGGGAVTAVSGAFVSNAIVDLFTLLTLAGAPGDVNTAASLMGRLTKIRDLLAATLTVQGTITEANSAAILTDMAELLTDTDNLATLVTNTTGLATQTTLAAILAKLVAAPALEGGNLAALVTNTADLLADGDNLAGISTNTSHFTDGTAKSRPQVAGADVSATNAMPSYNTAVAGEVALLGSNPAALTANTDASIKWGAGGTTQVNHALIANNSTVSVNYRLDAATTAGSDILQPGQKIVYDIPVTAVHLQSTGTPNVNGSTAGNVVVTGWL